MEPQQTIRWETPEYIWKPKTIDWFWALGIIAIATSVTAMLMGNVLFGVFILIAAGMLGYFSIRQPEIVEVEIDARNIRIKETKYPFRDIEAFWIDNEKGDNQLLILTKRFFMPLMAIPLADADHDVVREALINNIEERELVDTPAHKVLEGFGL